MYDFEIRSRSWKLVRKVQSLTEVIINAKFEWSYLRSSSKRLFLPWMASEECSSLHRQACYIISHKRDISYKRERQRERERRKREREREETNERMPLLNTSIMLSRACHSQTGLLLLFFSVIKYFASAVNRFINIKKLIFTNDLPHASGKLCLWFAIDW